MAKPPPPPPPKESWDSYNELRGWGWLEEGWTPPDTNAESTTQHSMPKTSLRLARFQVPSGNLSLVLASMSLCSGIDGYFLRTSATSALQLGLDKWAVSDDVCRLV